MKDKEFDKLIKIYQNNGKKPITFDFKNALKTTNSINYHYIHFYPGRIYPYIPRYLFSLDEFHELNSVLLDPFAGSGTILLESLINHFVKRETLGVEINPLGRLICKVKMTPFDISSIPVYMNKLSRIYSNSAKLNIDNIIPLYDNIEIWFSRNTINKLAKLKYAIQNLEVENDIKDFFWLCYSSIIRKVSKADPYIPPPVVLKLEKYKDTPKFNKLKEHLKMANNPCLWRIFEETVVNNSKKLNVIFNAFRSSTEGKIIWDDVRKIRKGILLERGFIDKSNPVSLPSNSVDIVFTSPPYLTAQKYIRTFKLELLWLGYSIEGINVLEKKSIGTERISLTNESIEDLGFKHINELIERTWYKSKHRAFSIYSYFKDMIEVVKELHRVVKNDGCLVLVVGDNKVLGKWIGTYKLLADIVVQNGFKELIVMKDRIKSRSMMTRRNGSGGLIKEEYVMIFQKEAQKDV